MKTMLLAVSTIGLLLLLPSCGGGAGSATDPAAVIKGFDAAQNAKNIDTAMTFVADDAVFNTPTGNFTGKDQVRKWVEDQVKSNDKVESFDFQVTGEKVMWKTNIFRGGSTSPVFVASNDATVQAGKIKAFNAH